MVYLFVSCKDNRDYLRRHIPSLTRGRCYSLFHFCVAWQRGLMGDGAILGHPPLLSGAALPWAPSRPPVMVGTEQNATLALVGLLLLLLALLLVRCFRVLLDPYSSMPASSWSDHKEVLERGQFEYTLV